MFLGWKVGIVAGVKQAPCHLYFGCRSIEKDFYYTDLWQRLLGKGVLAAQGGLVTAFSRDQGRKVYVTHRLAENAAQLFELLQQVGPWTLCDIFAIGILRAFDAGQKRTSLCRIISTFDLKLSLSVVDEQRSSF